MKLFFKCENFQRVGAFKFRGACNAVLKLNESQIGVGEKRALCTHSSGNHAQAVALTGKMFNMDAYIVMPKNSSILKKKAVSETYNANLIECENNLQSREETAARVCAEHKAIFIHPFDNSYV
jgi:threonine dehydratase